MKKVYWLLLFVAVFSAGCKKEEPNVVDKFVGTWVWNQTQNDATFKGDGKYLITIKKTSETSANVDYSYRFSGTYGGNAATQTSDGSLGLVNVENDGLTSTNVLFNIKTVLIYQKSGTPVTLNDNFSYKYAKLRLTINSSGELEMTQTADGGTPNTTKYQKQ